VWLEVITASIAAEARNITTLETYHTWVSSEVDMGERITRELARAEKGEQAQATQGKEARSFLDEAEQDYGVKIVRIAVRRLDPAGDLRELTLAQVKADYEAKAVKTRADAEAGRIRTVAAAIKEQGQLGQLMRTLEALEHTKEGMASVHLVPGLSEIVGSAFDRRRIEDLDESQISFLKELLQEMGVGSKQGDSWRGHSQQQRPQQKRRPNKRSRQGQPVQQESSDRRQEGERRQQ
jgi:hypothetical protein